MKQACKGGSGVGGKAKLGGERKGEGGVHRAGCRKYVKALPGFLS